MFLYLIRKKVKGTVENATGNSPSPTGDRNEAEGMGKWPPGPPS